MPQGLRAGTALAERDQLSALFDEVSQGLRSEPRRIPEKLFYDHRGSQLFEVITRLEAYYPTRLEVEILGRCLGEVRDLVGAGAKVVEFGSGSGRKTSQLLDALDRPATYVPIDISEAQLVGFADQLRAEYPEMWVVPLVADYSQWFTLPRAATQEEANGGRLLFFFPGSTIGNFEPDEAERFLRRIGLAGGAGSSLLIGVDLVKEREVLERAYDDPEGVTAEFNRNALHHLNDLFDGNFTASAYRHRAVWNVERSRIEMHLVSTLDQEVILNSGLSDTEPLQIRLQEGEVVVTEHSYKYRPDQFESLCLRAGWTGVQRWTDDLEWFSVHFLEREA